MSDEGASRAAKDIFAGTVSGIVQVLTGQPFDTIKVRLQTDSKASPKYAGALDCVRKTRANDGLRGFYKGTLTPLVGIGACVSVQFGVLEHMKRSLADANGELSLGNLFVAGASAGLANSVIACPVEHIRTRLQVQTAAKSAVTSAASAPYKGPLDAISQIHRSHGLAGLYKGQAITTVREGLGYGVYFFIYEYLMKREMQRLGRKRQDIDAVKACGFGAFSGVCLWLAIYPIDVVKSKLQTDGFTAETQRFRGSLDCMRKTLAEDGWRGLYRGFGTCMTRAMPVNAATFLAFEMTMNAIGR